MKKTTKKGCVDLSVLYTEKKRIELILTIQNENKINTYDLEQFGYNTKKTIY